MRLAFLDGDAPLLDTPTGARFVFPNAPKPFEAYPGMTFGWTWFEGWPPVHASLVESRGEMLSFLDEITEKYPTPDGKLIVGGFSLNKLLTPSVICPTLRHLYCTEMPCSKYFSASRSVSTSWPFETAPRVR